MQCLYRVEAYDSVVVRRYPVVKKTPCGVKIDVGGEEKFVNLSARKQYANETVEEARTAFLARNRKRIQFLTNQLEAAKLAREAVERWNGDVGETNVHYIEDIYPHSSSFQLFEDIKCS